MFYIYFYYYLLLIDVLHSKYTDKNESDEKLSTILLSPSLSSKTLKSCKTDDKINTDESNKRENKCYKPKVRHLVESKENCSRVAIQVSKNGIIEVISDKETMVWNLTSYIV